MVTLRSSLPPGNYPYPSVDSPHKSQAVASYEEKVRLHAERVMRRHNHHCLNSDVALGIRIDAVTYVEPLGVTKAVLDALSGGVYGDDSQVKRLSVSLGSTMATRSSVQVTVEALGTDRLWRFTIPDTPVGKGMAFVGTPDGNMELPQPSGIRFEPWHIPNVNRRISRQVSRVPDIRGISIGDPNEQLTISDYISDYLVDITVSGSSGDIDNVLRYYIHELQAGGYLGDLTYVKHYRIALVDDKHQGAIIRISHIE